MNAQAQPLVTKAEAARLSGLSYSTIVRLTKRGVLREITAAPGMRPRLRLSDVIALSEPNEHAP